MSDAALPHFSFRLKFLILETKKTLIYIQATFCLNVFFKNRSQPLSCCFQSLTLKNHNAAFMQSLLICMKRFGQLFLGSVQVQVLR